MTHKRFTGSFNSGIHQSTSLSIYTTECSESFINKLGWTEPHYINPQPGICMYSCEKIDSMSAVLDHGY